jgi:hypothetical protein
MDVKEIAESLANADKMLRIAADHPADIAALRTAVIHTYDALCGCAALLGVPGAVEPETGTTPVTTDEA